MKRGWQRIESIVLNVHRRNGGELTYISQDFRLLQPELGLDSLDLAEILVAVEKEFGIAPFESEHPPKTWGEVLDLAEEKN